MSETVIPKLTAAEHIFKALVWDVALKAILVYVFGPLMTTWGISTIIQGGFGALGDFIFDFAVKFIDIKTIRFLNAEAQDHYESASIKLAVIAEEQGISSDEFIKARDLSAAAQSKLTQFHR